MQIMIEKLELKLTFRVIESGHRGKEGNKKSVLIMEDRRFRKFNRR